MSVGITFLGYIIVYQKIAWLFAGTSLLSSNFAITKCHRFGWFLATERQASYFPLAGIEGRKGVSLQGNVAARRWVLFSTAATRWFHFSSLRPPPWRIGPSVLTSTRCPLYPLWLDMSVVGCRWQPWSRWETYIDRASCSKHHGSTRTRFASSCG